MSQAAEAASTRARVSVISDGVAYDTFDVLEIAGDIVRARSPYLFEIGEELAIRVEGSGAPFEAQARVRAHTGTADDRVTELELTDRTQVT